MKNSSTLKDEFSKNTYKDLLNDIYVDSGLLDYQTERYINAIDKFTEAYGERDIEIYSAPGRSEIGGNHTDHQHGIVLAASINLDAIGIVSKEAANKVQIISGNYNLISVSLDDLAAKKSEEGTTLSLIKGVLAYLKSHGFAIGGFNAYITSDVLIGAGLSSSAAFETIIGTIISGLYNDMKITPVEIAIAGQYAENVYFGKPCGLMDQMASSVGSLVNIDFNDPENPVVDKVEFDLEKAGYSLCIVDTKGSHADLTPEYAAIPIEMKSVASYFAKDVLREVSLAELFKAIPKLRKEVGDRAVLRAIHFACENERAHKEALALKENNVGEFLDLVKKSGASSFQYLQNVYVSSDVTHQNMSIALAASEAFLGDNGVCRVHGGGFAGTIQAFVKNESVASYKELMDGIFGTDSCHILKIRKYGGMKVVE